MGLNQILIVFVLLVVSIPLHSFSRPYAGTFSGKTLYWETRDYTTDTIQWDDIEKKYELETYAKGPHGAIEAFDSAGYMIYELRELTALSAAILRDLDYNLILMSKVFIFPHGEIKYGGGETYERRNMHTDFYWESITEMKLANPPDQKSPYGVILEFSGGGGAELPGDEFVDAQKHILSKRTGNYRIDFVNTTQHKNVKHRIYEAFLITKKSESPKSIIRQIEGVMDQLKVDITHPVPKLVPVKTQ